jgi:hypothetical protein
MGSVYAEDDAVKWVDSNKSMQQYVNEGFAIVAYAREMSSPPEPKQFQSYILQKSKMIVRCDEIFFPRASSCRELQ